MERFVTDERTGLKYELVGDYYLIAGDDEPEGDRPIGVWRQRHLRYLKKHRRVRYANLLTSGELNAYNTLPEEKKARYDARKILRDMSRMMFSCVGCMAVGILGSIVDAPWLVVLGIVLTVLVIVFFLIRINRESKR